MQPTHTEPPGYDPGGSRDLLPLTTPNPPTTAALPPLGAGVTVDTLLKSTTSPGDPGFVHYGSFRVPTAMQADFEKAERYLAHDPEAVKTLAALVNDPAPHTLHPVDALTDSRGDRFEASGTFGAHPTQNGGDIYWDSHAALRSSNGTAITPALALLHEQGHAWEWKSDPAGFIAGVHTANRRYDTAEEQRNESGLERRAAADLHDGTRDDHGGFAYRVAEPTGKAPTGPRETYTPQQLLDHVRNGVANVWFHGYKAPPMPGDPANVTPWDHKAHTGTFVAVDAHTVAQHVGGGKFQVYDVERDLHGVYPTQTQSLSVDARGHESRGDAHVPAHAHAGGHAGR